MITQTKPLDVENTTLRTLSSDELEKQFALQREKFNDELRKRGYYPDATHPGNCYIFDVVLGIDPRTVAADLVTRKGYTAFWVNPDGTRTRVKRTFDSYQQKVLREWWELLSTDVR